MGHPLRGLQLAGLACASLLPSAALAELDNSPLIGVGLRSRPAYDGSASQTLEAVPVVRQFGRIGFVRSTQDVLEAGLRIETLPGLHAGAQADGRPGRPLLNRSGENSMNAPQRLTRRTVMASLAVPGLVGACAAWAAPPASVQMEVNFLLGYVEGSGCDFERNGSWHTSVQAQVHLRTKFDYLVRTDALKTTEQFIDDAASRSSMSGRAYRIRCPRGEPTASGPWLHEELARMRGRP